MDCEPGVVSTSWIERNAGALPAAIMAAVAATLGAQPVLVTKPMLTPRREHEVVFDELRGRLMVFGGRAGDSGNGVPQNDTWEWDGAVWLRRESGPGGRLDMSATWDSMRGRVVAFGGFSSTNYTFLSDTWEWDGVAWRTVATSGPPASAGHAMVFDVVRGRSVLFGGFGVDTRGASVVFDQTWEWDGTAWSRRATSTAPRARHGHAMAYDAARRRVVLFGGSDDREGSTVFGDTWEWDGSTWTRASSPNAPPARWAAAMVYDPVHAVSVLFGGRDTTTDLGDLWSWDGSVWTPLTSLRSPSPRSHHAMAFDPTGGRIRLFSGGHAPRNDFWEWDGSTWTELATPSPGPRFEHAMAWDPAHRQVLCFGGAAREPQPSPLEDTWHWDGAAWTRLFPTTSPLGRHQHAMVTDSIRSRVVLFGGFRSYWLALFSDTWEWDGTTWSDRSPATGPSPRRDTAMAYDAVRGEVVLFGGAEVASNPVGLGDTWVWDGSIWRQRTPAQSPPRRYAHAMAYDSVRQRTVLYGGSAYLTGPHQDTWEWDGASWSSRGNNGPRDMVNHVMVYDTVRRRVVLHGSPFNRTVFEWDGTIWTGFEYLERHSHGGAYDEVRQRCVFFGGQTTPSRDVIHGDVLVYGDTAAAHVNPFGAGCAGAAGVPQLALAGSPALAATFRFDVVHAQPGALVILALSGTSADIPFPGGCRVRIDPTTLLLAPWLGADAQGFASLRLSLPAEPSLVRLALYAQAGVVESPPRLVVSNAWQLLLGD